jgi:hypothetical protein
MSSRISKVLLLAGALASVSGCGVLRSMAGRNTVDLEGADVRSMGVDIRKQQKTICPRERVQMAVFADVLLRGETQVQKLETWEGDANRNGKMDFEPFAFHSEQGSFDQEGWFTPNPDLARTAAREFELRTVYRKRPDKFSFTTTYKPDYRCITAGGASGEPGASGASGATGTAGESGSFGSSESAGGNGGDGRPGGSGGDGGPGGAGASLEAFATYVKTPFYEKLVAIRIVGSQSDFLLVHPESAFVLEARGGPGGAGGNGGRGGDGGRGGSGNPAGAGGRGAQGGNGGNGGAGGPGGSVKLVVDERFPEIAQVVKIDVSGGAGGPPGGPGGGGSRGSGGTGMNGAATGTDGTEGQQGQSGAAGSNGPQGSATSALGAVAEKFSGLQGIELL